MLEVGGERKEQSSGEEVNSADSDESSGESGDSDAESSVSIMNKEEKQPLPMREEYDIPGPCWINTRSKIVRKIGISDHVTSCGRRVNAATFTWSKEGSNTRNPRCTHCFRNELITSREEMSARLGWSLVSKSSA